MQWRVRSARERREPAGFILPCQPVLADRVPAGDDWIHELKHDGYRIVARKEQGRVRLWSRNAVDWTERLPAIAAAIAVLPAEQIFVDGEAVCQREDGLPDFHALRTAEGCERAVLFAFDLLMVNGEDLRPRPLGERRHWLEELVLSAPPSAITFSEAYDGSGAELFEHACRLGLEGIVSKRRDAPYRSGRSETWRKIKCPDYRRL